MELSEILYQKTNDQLKQLTKLISGCYGATRKDDLVGCIHQAVMGSKSLRQLWQQLDDLSKKAVAVAYHNDGEFNAGAFVAQYGQLPERPSSGQWFRKYETILLDLFLYNNRLPSDLRLLLEPLVPPPDKFQVQGLATAPKVVVSPDEYVTELICVENEQAGLHDLTAYLRLVAQGQLNTSSSTGATTLSGVKKIVKSLLVDDFLPLPEKYRANQTIRPFGLDIFARESGLVAYRRRSGLGLTKAGQQYYQTQDPDILLEAFETWTQEGGFDELGRVSAVKGQKSKQTHLTPPASRREAIIEALSWCPVNVWIDIQDFYRALKIWHFDFDVETTYYGNLYVGYKDYELYGDAYWAVVKGLYINVVLWEYLGSLGGVDLLYTHPEDADFEVYLDFYDDHYLSLYDGLKYFRINNLGAYLLGQTGEYIPAKPRQPTLLAISPDMKVTITEPDALTPNDRHQLELMAAPLKNGLYRLDTSRLLSAIEAGSDWQQLIDFLESRHRGPLPEEVLAWLEKLQQNSRAFKEGDRALFIRVESADLAEMALSDPVLQKFSKQIDQKTLVIPTNKEKTFRSRLKELEYVLLN
jgi:hypothetical protein